MKRKIINDPVYDGFLTIDDPLILNIIDHPLFQRQRYIKQLGFTYLVYPGAVHTRFSHMLGALNLIDRALQVLRQKNVPISDTECQAAKIAILLHDIGHGPFSHTSEKTLTNVHHEHLTLLFMQQLDLQFDHQLQLAISIFNDTYPRHFLHQLVSSQLDMDRLDYLGRDSFFTGVSEGIVGTHRIISMLNVHNDQLVVDEKGIYSIEKFIISRRLMYWQVYLHHTVIAADNLFYSILRRARQLLLDNVDLQGYPPLLTLLRLQPTADHFQANPNLLQTFASIDDGDVISTLKIWTNSTDPVLATLCRNLLYRRLPKIIQSSQPFPTDLINQHIEQVAQTHHLTPQQAAYFVGTGALVNSSYSFNDQEIKILFKDQHCLGISQASDQLDHHFLEKTVKKYYLYFPKIES